MHDLIPLVGNLPGTLTDAEIDSVATYLAAEKAASTVACYLSDWTDFSRWCGQRGLLPLPALPGTIAAYLSSLADQGRKASTIARRRAAIAERHKQAGIDPVPAASAGVRSTLKGIRRTIGVARTQKAAATAGIVRKMMDACPEYTLISLRDRALK
jgi:site-specific recombinase XerD